MMCLAASIEGCGYDPGHSSCFAAQSVITSSLTLIKWTEMKFRSFYCCIFSAVSLAWIVIDRFVVNLFFIFLFSLIELRFSCLFRCRTVDSNQPIDSGHQPIDREHQQHQRHRRHWQQDWQHQATASSKSSKGQPQGTAARDSSKRNSSNNSAASSDSLATAASISIKWQHQVTTACDSFKQQQEALAASDSSKRQLSTYYHHRQRTVVKRHHPLSSSRHYHHFCIMTFEGINCISFHTS